MDDTLIIYNTLTRKKELFKPINSPFVGMYVCGPTVYGDAHLGHARPAITFDLVYRYLSHLGYKVRYVRNITDVGHLEHDADEGEDKIAKKARIEQKEPMEIVQYYLNRYHKNMEALNVLPPSIEPHASGHIIEQIAFVQQIMDAGYAYESEGSVYFDVEKYNKKYHYGKLSGRNIDDILESSYIEELIQDHPYSIFPQMRNTERPDVVVSSLLEGRVAIITDNTPVALIAPGEFFSLMQTAEDYYNRYAFSSLIRLLRYFCLIIAMLLPALYIAITNYHQEMVPNGLLISIISTRAQVPFPALVEALSMEITFEILREAGVRLPKPIGQAVSIVGALVIGQAAVQANIVSPLMVIVVALTGIATFAIPQFNLSLPVRILRFFLMLLASVFGMYGVMIGILFIMLHLFSMESFGKPYMAPLSPLRTGDFKDTLIRFPWWALVKRPVNSSRNSKRMQSGQIPHPPQKRGGRQ